LSSPISRSSVLTDRPRCLVVDGHPLVRLGVRDLLDRRCEVEELSTRAEAVELIEDVGDFDVAVVEMGAAANGSRQSLSGLDAIRAMRKASPGLGIVAHGESTERHLCGDALSAGAGAYVTKGADSCHLVEAVGAVLDQEGFVDPAIPQRGSRGRITRRQRQILQLLAEGESAGVAARTLGLSEETVKSHTKNIMARLSARNRAHAVAIGIRESLIE
jgi:DNA-binding NarL/FixJ family response regulator